MPVTCLHKIKGLSCRAIVAGNHDWAAADNYDTVSFNFIAREAVTWTAGRLTSEDKEFLRSLPLIYKDNLITLVHGTLYEAKEFNYMLDIYTAAKDFDLLKTQISFIGHTHLPGIFSEEDYQISYSTGQKIVLKPNLKYIVNAGSIGQPRDGERKSCLVIFDSEEKSIEFKRVEYDLRLAQKKIIRAGLPERLASRLEVGR